MRTSEFDYELPPELIAQQPARPRDRSRLMVLDRQSGYMDHRYFYELPELLKKGDTLVLNESRVFPARLYARKLPGGGRVAELTSTVGESADRQFRPLGRLGPDWDTTGPGFPLCGVLPSQGGSVVNSAAVLVRKGSSGAYETRGLAGPFGGVAGRLAGGAPGWGESGTEGPVGSQFPRRQ